MSANAVPVSIRPTVKRRPFAAGASTIFRRPEAGAATGAVVVFAFFAIFGGPSGFLGAAGFASWLSVAAELGIIALAVGLLMISGEFDLSVGSILAASSMVTATCISILGLPTIVGAILGLALGIGIGFLNGLLVVKTGLPSFIVTMVTLFVLSGASLGLARLIAGTTSVSLSTSDWVTQIFAGKWGQFPISILWWLVAAGVASFVLHRAKFGNWIFAVGSGGETALTTGVPVARVKIRLYMYSGFSASLVGVIQAFEFQNADVTRGQNFVFQAIVAAVVGGCLLSGGYGSAAGIVLGAATFAIVTIGIYYTGWAPDLVQLFVGVLLLLAVLGNNFVRRLALTRS